MKLDLSKLDGPTVQAIFSEVFSTVPLLAVECAGNTFETTAVLDVGDEDMLFGLPGGTNLVVARESILSFKVP